MQLKLIVLVRATSSTRMISPNGNKPFFWFLSVGGKGGRLVVVEGVKKKTKQAKKACATRLVA